MGTNYYTKTEKCTCCEHKLEGVHLGKSSVGWQFSFQYNGGQFYKNVKEMKKWLKEKKIENEYGEEVPHDEFWKMVKAKQVPANKNHAEYCKIHHPTQPPKDFVIDGYSFTDCEFS